MRTTLLLLLLALLTTTATAQESKVKYGFFAGAVLRLNSFDQHTKEGVTFTTVNYLGYAAGANVYYQPAPVFSLRGTLGLHLEGDELKFSSREFSSSTKLISPFLSTGVHALLKRNEQSRWQLVAGLTPYFRLNSEDNSAGTGLRAFDLASDLGVNYSFPVKSVQIMPELRFSRSLTNAASENGLAGMLNSYYRHRLSFSVHLVI